jgi:hypothetical protein
MPWIKFLLVTGCKLLYSTANRKAINAEAMMAFQSDLKVLGFSISFSSSLLFS